MHIMRVGAIVKHQFLTSPIMHEQLGFTISKCVTNIHGDEVEHICYKHCVPILNKERQANSPIDIFTIVLYVSGFGSCDEDMQGEGCIEDTSVSCPIFSSISTTNYTSKHTYHKHKSDPLYHKLSFISTKS